MNDRAVSLAIVAIWILLHVAADVESALKALDLVGLIAVLISLCIIAYRGRTK